VQKKISWTPAMLARFKLALADHKENDVIVFDGNEFVVAYGRYLVEYLEGQFHARGDA